MIVRLLGLSIVLACVAHATTPTGKMIGYVEWQDGVVKPVDLLPLYPNGIALPPNENNEIPFSFSTGKGLTRVIGIRLVLKDDTDTEYDVVIVAPSEGEEITTSGKWIGTTTSSAQGIVLDTPGGVWAVRRWPVIRSGGISVGGASGVSTSQPASGTTSQATTREYTGLYLSPDASLAFSVKFPTNGDDRRVRVAATGDWAAKQVTVTCAKPGGSTTTSTLANRGYFVLANYAGSGSVSTEAPTSPDASAADQSDWVRFVGMVGGVK